MTESHERVILKSDVNRVWEVITDLNSYGWRSDLREIEVIEPGRKFVEYTKEGFPTVFTITRFEPPHRYEFTMENANMSGTWSGVLSRNGQGCEADFTERVTVKKWFMRPFAAGFLRKQQKQYFRDLKVELGE